MRKVDIDMTDKGHHSTKGRDLIRLKRALIGGPSRLASIAAPQGLAFHDHRRAGALLRPHELMGEAPGGFGIEQVEVGKLATVLDRDVPNP